MLYVCSVLKTFTKINYMKLLQFLFIFSISFSFAQPSQNVRGKCVDNETSYPLVGVKIILKNADSTHVYKVISNPDGEFQILNAAIGKYELSAFLNSYELKTMTIEINSGKESILNVVMSESFTELDEVKVSARKKGEVINELAVISAQQFSVEETNRYPGSRMDPARMASNFAGVQGADDSRNDIIIRGNSPLGVVWRIEGIDIPNPSHFAISGSTGGPVSIINNKLLGNSDFFMSAFPAEYGNSISGVFDLKLRNGNNKNHEATFQFGFLGTELMAEGPLSKKGNSSYLVMGRYSTLSLMQKIGIQLGTDAVPVYGDYAFKLNWNLKRGGAFSVFSLGGKSKIDILISDQKEFSADLYGESDRDQYFGTTMAVFGLNYKKPLNEKTFLNVTLAQSFDEQHSKHEYVLRHLDTNAIDGSLRIQVDSIYPMMKYQYKNFKTSNQIALNHKISKRHFIRFGVNTDVFFVNQQDSALALVTDTQFVKRWDFAGSSFLLQPFVQWKWRATENMDLTLGVHAQYFSLSNSTSYAEPRFGWKYRMKKNQSIFAGAGVHSQTQPYYTYTYHKLDANGSKIYHNKNMDFTKSIHTGFGYEKSFNKSFNVRSEVYYQYLYKIPVTTVPSAYSLINMGGGFQRFFPDSLSNTGTGVNYGIEVTVQKYFDKSFFFMFSGSLYDSKYKGSDGVVRNTSYNGMYVCNLLAGKEFKLNEKQSISIGLKTTVAGGKRYGYADIQASKKLNEIIFKDSLFNERQFRDYFRMDLKINWKYNTSKVTHEIGLDLVNIFNTKNLLSLAYSPNLANPNADPISEKQQLGFLPIFYYKIDFHFNKKQ